MMVSILSRAFAHRLPLTRLAVFLAVSILAGELHSQPGGTVSGMVTAANKMPLSQARVRVVGSDLATLTHVDGAFEVAQIPAGRQSVEVAMIGYAPRVLALLITEGQRLTVSIVLEPLPLEPVTVTADANFFLGMGGFLERKARGSGRFFTREDILRIHPRQVTDVLRRVPGMQIDFASGGLGGGNQSARSARNNASAGSESCTMTYYVNGSPFPLSGDMSSINHYIATDDIAAIEVYSGSSEIPAEFNSSQLGARCGVVAIWTSSSLDPRGAHD